MYLVQVYIGVIYIYIYIYISYVRMYVYARVKFGRLSLGLLCFPPWCSRKHWLAHQMDLF